MLLLLLQGLFVYSVSCQSFAADTSIDPKELKCLVCEASIKELDIAISKLDPSQKVDVGGHRLDASGNYNHKTVPKAKSELHLSEMIEEVCNRMDDYIRAKWKSNGTLTLLHMIGPDGTMNPNWSDVDVIQDEDLNKSLKYYCESMMEEYEENVIRLFQIGVDDVKRNFCIEESKICPPESLKVEL